MYDSQEVFVSYTHSLCSASALILKYNIKICLLVLCNLSESSGNPELHHQCQQSQPEWLCVGPHHPEMSILQTPSPDVSGHHHYHYTPKCFLAIHRGE